jgi:hypothetical protein
MLLFNPTTKSSPPVTPATPLPALPGEPQHNAHIRSNCGDGCNEAGTNQKGIKQHLGIRELPFAHCGPRVLDVRLLTKIETGSSGPLEWPGG